MTSNYLTHMRSPNQVVSEIRQQQLRHDMILIQSHVQNQQQVTKNRTQGQHSNRKAISSEPIT